MRDLTLVKNNPALPYYFIWTSALTANIRNVRLIPYVMILNLTTCYNNNTNFIDAISNRPNMMTCVSSCNQKVVNINGYQICISNLSSYSAPSTQLAPSLWLVMFGTSSQICKSFTPLTLPLNVSTISTLTAPVG